MPPFLEKSRSHFMRERATGGNFRKSHRAGVSRNGRRIFHPKPGGSPISLAAFPVWRNSFPNFLKTIPIFPATLPNATASVPILRLAVPNFPTVAPDFSAAAPIFPKVAPIFPPPPPFTMVCFPAIYGICCRAKTAKGAKAGQILPFLSFASVARPAF